MTGVAGGANETTISLAQLETGVGGHGELSAYVVARGNFVVSVRGNELSLSTPTFLDGRTLAFTPCVGISPSIRVDTSIVLPDPVSRDHPWLAPVIFTQWETSTEGRRFVITAGHALEGVSIVEPFAKSPRSSFVVVPWVCGLVLEAEGEGSNAARCFRLRGTVWSSVADAERRQFSRSVDSAVATFPACKND